jgi:uncharacterized membrane protein
MSYGQVIQQGPMGPMNGSAQNQLLFILIILLLLVVIVLLFYKWPRPASVEKPENAKDADKATGSVAEDKLEVALRLLDENERKVVEAIVAEGGSMLQKDISINLGLSRVKTHRTVQSLVKRGLVTTEEHYNTNKVTMVDWLKE